MSNSSSEYDRFGESFARSRKSMRWEEVDFLCGFLDSFSEPPNVLDVGCWSGRLVEHLDHVLASSGYQYLGTDVSSVLVNCARKSFPHLDFVVSDMRTLEDNPFVTSRSPFDAVFAIASLHHLLRREDRIRTLKGFASLSFPGGWLLMTNWNLLSESNLSKYGKYRDSEGVFHIPFSGAPRSYAALSEDGIRDELHDAGWKIEVSFLTERNLVTVARFLPE